MRNYIITGLVGLCVFIFFMFVPFIRLIKFNAQESQYKQRVETLNTQALGVESEQIKREIESYTKYIEKVEYLTKNKVIVTDELHELEPYVPQDVVFDSLTYSKTGLKINATAQKMDSISELTANLQLSSNYKDVRINSVTAENQNTANESYKFTIDIVK